MQCVMQATVFKYEQICIGYLSYILSFIGVSIDVVT